MSDDSTWASAANEALRISIIEPGETGPKDVSSFNPLFTYPVFGNEEQIFGYRGLEINLRFAAHNLRPNLEFKYDQQIEAVGETKATDLAACLEPFTIKQSFSPTSSYLQSIQNETDAKSFKPPGELVDKYTSKGRNFEVWSGSLSDPEVKLLVSRIQILVSLFIEAGTPLELQDQDWTLSRWRIYFVYEKLATPPTPNASSYSIVGYSTAYRFITYVPPTSTTATNGNAALPIPKRSSAVHDFALPPSEPLHPDSLPARVRISQFLILPSHHSHGHGSHLYNAMVATMLASPTCTEITVEDPNEAFDDLRDYADFTRLTRNGTFAAISFNTTISPALTALRPNVRVPTSELLDPVQLGKLRTKNKIAPRQFSRLVELYLFSRIAPFSRQAGTARLTQRGKTSNDDDRAFYYWRLLVKQRVYKQNRDVLMQVDRAERAEKVGQTVGEVAGDYERLLRGIRKWEAAEKESSQVGASSSTGRDKGKRARVVDEEDDDNEEEVDVDGSAAKRVRSDM